MTLAVIATCVAVSLIPIAPSPAIATTTVSASSSADSQSAPDEATALSLAGATGHPVRVDGETTTTSSVSAQPNGGFQMRIDTVPVRAKKDGVWSDLDESLRANDDGMFEPVNAALPVHFGPGGSDLLDEVQAPGGDWVRETWPFGALPVPQVSGDTATYAGALPGVDIRLKATATGMSTVLVVKNASAATDPRLRAFRLDASGANLAPTTTDQMLATAPDGSTVTAGSPLWWDSTQGGSADGPGGDEPDRPVKHVTDSTGLSLDVAQTVASTPVKYPIYIDPDWSSGVSTSWYTDAAYPDQSYLDPASSDVLRVGSYAQWNSYMYFEYPIGALSGKTVLAASLATTQLSIDACPTNAISIEVYGPQWAGFTWNQQAGPWRPAFASQTPGSCSNPSATVPVGWDVTSALQSQIGQTWIQFCVFGATDYTRRHFSRAATMYVSYDTPPNTPTALSMSSPNRACGTASAPAIVNSTVPWTFTATVTDPDPGASVNANFYVMAASQVGSSSPTAIAMRNPGNYPPGVLSVTFPANTVTSPGLYAWRVLAGDGVLLSPYSGYCYIQVVNTPPPAPTVTTSATTMTVGVGVPVTLGTGSGSGVVGYEYWLSRFPSTTPAAPAPIPNFWSSTTPACGSQSAGTTIACPNATITVAPIDDNSVLWAAAYDAAGNVSKATPLPLQSNGGTAATLAGTASFHSWPMNGLSTPYPAVVPDSNTGTATDTTGSKPLTKGTTSTWVSDSIGTTTGVPTLAFAGATSNTATTSGGPSIDTTKSFTVSAWVKPTSVTGTHTIIAQSGASRSGFILEQVSGVMTMCVQPQVGVSSPDCAAAPSASPAGSWIMVTGIWDAVNHQVRIILGDVGSEAVAPHVPPSGDVTAGGTVTVGAAQAGGALANPWTGDIENPVLVQEVLDTQTLNALYGTF